MTSQRMVEASVGFFFLMALTCLIILAFKVSGLTNIFPRDHYILYATFDDIGGLKVKAPVKIGGVQIGHVENIDLDTESFRASVKLQIDQHFNQIPKDSEAQILTSGLLGDNYIAITPMYEKEFLQNGSVIALTQSAMVLEKLIGQFMYKIGGSQEKNKDAQPNGGASDVT